ncbi:DUF4468 domain-containing protein [Reichenbachiella agariperforans]|uniref:DUF4468 domain-containing protein n=1 Tax=Reichenbachiella agariperforans TaxID=156994 RepID=UPI001C0A5069|nr:DUF4468 domain-containing protein [Reichenbachiella agariperforans]MBU2913640.1 DUF4468 domain-containing protein [Reichenbachiella agariperforans]
MKRIIFILVVMASFQATAQLTLESGKYIHQKIVRVEGDKVELYRKAQAFVENRFSGSEHKIYSLEAENKIRIKATQEHELDGMPNAVSYTLVIECLDGMYRETVKDLTYRTKGKVYVLEDKKLKAKKKIIPDLDGEFQVISESLKTSMYGEMMAQKQP